MRASLGDDETMGWGDNEASAFSLSDCPIAAVNASISSSVGGRPTRVNFSLRKIAAGLTGADGFGDVSTLADPAVVPLLVASRADAA